MQVTLADGAVVDLDKFRLRRFIEQLAAIGEVEVHDEPLALADLSRIIEASAKATHFKRVGHEQFEMVGAVCGGRRRFAAALGVDAREIAHEMMRRLAAPQAVAEVPSQQAPVHQVVLTGDDVDLTRLPFHFQHEYDGGPYISAAIDFSIDPATGRNNIGCRRLMMRGRREMLSNLTDRSDLKTAYLGCLERKERFPVSFAIGSHPLDFLAATSKLPGDEFALLARLRGEPLAMVRGVTNAIPVPADAEMVIEGYFDELGYRETEGPYGEFYGFYGPVHPDPVFHATAITMRKDALHQTVLHSGRRLDRTDSANLGSVHTEVAIWRALRAAGIEPAAVHAVPATNGRQHARVAIARAAAGEAKAVIATLFGLVPVKHVFVVDDNVDVFCAEEMEWALSTRFRADRDLVVTSGLPGFYADPTADEERQVAKMGFDCTAGGRRPERVDERRAFAPRPVGGTPSLANVRAALADGPLYFSQLMEALGSRDGREIAIELDALREQGALVRCDNGEWALKDDPRP